MSLLPFALGGLLGLGALLAWRGFRAATDRSLNRRARRRGMWTLNGGLALAAASMLGFTWLAGD